MTGASVEWRNACAIRSGYSSIRAVSHGVVRREQFHSSSAALLSLRSVAFNHNASSGEAARLILVSIISSSVGHSSLRAFALYFSHRYMLTMVSHSVDCIKGDPLGHRRAVLLAQVTIGLPDKHPAVGVAKPPRKRQEIHTSLNTV